MIVIVARNNRRAANYRKPPHAITAKARSMLAHNRLPTYHGGPEMPSAATACRRGEGIARVGFH